jgi:hypothetical protein
MSRHRLTAVETLQLPEVETEAGVDSHVYVHVHVVRQPDQALFLRIWPSTFLVDTGCGVKSPLVHVENITWAPTWTFVPEMTDFRFLLIFNSLPRTCTCFDLVEEINQPGRLYIPHILRNTTDIYHVSLPL